MMANEAIVNEMTVDKMTSGKMKCCLLYVHKMTQNDTK